jgi:hypothetical protein
MNVQGQQITVHSPTAANLGVYGEMPVSYYTGTPNISIPLYEIKGKQVTVPVSLSYHPSGIRPEIHPGPVGLGWSLQAGGVISRTVRGNSPDESEYNSSYVEGYLKYAGGWMAKSNWKDNAKDAMNTNCLNCRNAAHYVAPFSDLEPDEFNFSFLSISGKFYFDHNGKIQVQCDDPVKVIFNNEFINPGADGIGLDYSHSSNSHRAFKSFIIIDDKGTQYHFGGATAIEFSDPISYGRHSNGYGIPATGELLQATSWFLTKIQSADGADIINFEYERGPFVCQLYRSYIYYSYEGAGMSGSGYNNLLKDGTLISPVYLKSIARVNGEEIILTYTVSNDLKYSHEDYKSLFFYQSIEDYKLLDMTYAIPRFQSNRPYNKYDRIQWLKLDAVSVKNTVNESVRTIHFAYNNNPAERLFLESLKLYGDGTQLEPPIKYTFTYKNRNKLPTQYLSCITDHWGFNNGRTHQSNGFIPQNKTPDAYYTDSGVLSEIRYPTGGSSVFEYELHDYAKVVDRKNRSVLTSQQGTAGGLRIKKISTDGRVREFFYKATPTSSLSGGILNLLPQYSYSISGKDCGNASFSWSITRSVPVIPLGKDNDGLHIGYTYVCERVSDGSGGYTQYNYTNHDNGHSDLLLANGKWKRDIFPSDPHCSRYFERGRLKKETRYNAGGQAISVNETVWNRYGSQGEDNPRAFLFEGIKVGYDYCSSAAYLHYCYKFLPKQKTETVYDSNGQNPVVTVTKYGYNEKHLISAITIENSDGKTSGTGYDYAWETYPELGMLNRHILSPVALQTDVIAPASIIIVPVVKILKNEYQMENGFPVLSKVSTGRSASTLETEVNYSKYDTKGNLLQKTGRDNVPVTYLWSYKNQYPIAEIRNATYFQTQVSHPHL